MKNHQGIDDDELEYVEFEIGSGRLPRIKGPLFEDSCGHKKEDYVASFYVVDFRRKEDGTKEHFIEYYDLYAFSMQFSGTNLCMRYGNEGHEYLSPGPCLSYFMGPATRGNPPNPPYERALQILREDGVFCWKRNERECISSDETDGEDAE